MIINGGNQAHGMVFVVEKRGVGSIGKFALDVKEPDMGLHAEAPMSCLVIDGWAYSHGYAVSTSKCLYIFSPSYGFHVFQYLPSYVLLCARNETTGPHSTTIPLRLSPPK